MITEREIHNDVINGKDQTNRPALQFHRLVQVATWNRGFIVDQDMKKLGLAPAEAKLETRYVCCGAAAS